MGTDIMLSIRGLSASAEGKRILDDISLDIPAGQTHVIMGPNLSLIHIYSAASFSGNTWTARSAQPSAP